MKRLFTLVTAFIFLTSSAIANEQHTIPRKMDASKALAAITTPRDRDEEEDQLAGRSRRACGDCGRYARCSARSPYAGLTDFQDNGRHNCNGRHAFHSAYATLRPSASSVYQSLRPINTPRKEEINGSRAASFERSAGWVQITSGEVSHSRPVGQTVSTTIKSNEQYDCDECDVHKRLPFVCERKFCSKNYVVVFGAKWCSFCPKMYPVVRQLRKAGYFVLYIDTDQYPQVTQQFKLTSWPTTVVMDQGKEKVRFTGVTTVEKIKKLLTKTRKEQEEPNYDFRNR